MIIQKILICLLAAAVLCAAGCSRPGPPEGVVSMALRSDPLFLNPVIASEMSSQTVNYFIFNALVTYNAQMEIVPDLAGGWESDGQGKIWTFYLRKDVKWHDGQPFTAADVRFTFEKLFDPSTNTFNRGLFQIDGRNPVIETPDAHTVVFRLPEPFSPFITNLAQLQIIPRHLLEGKDINRDEFNWHPTGTGPFRFNRWRSSEYIYLTANESYFKGRPGLKGLQIKIIPSAESRRIALMTGTVDVSQLSPEDLPAVEKCENINVYDWEQFVYYYMGFDLTNPLFQDVKLRKAINYSINKKEIIHAIFKDTAREATGPVPHASAYYSENVCLYDYNPVLAAQLLRESGWKKNTKGILEKEGRPLKFELMYPSGNSACEKAAVFIQAQLREPGILVQLKSMEFSALLNSCYPGKFQAILLNWVESFDPDNYTEWHSQQSGDEGMNFMSYSNPEADRLLEAGRSTAGFAARKKIYGRLQYVITADAPYVFLWSPKGLAAVNRRVGGFEPPGPASIFSEPEKLYTVPAGKR